MSITLHPLTSYSESFENNPDLAAWATPPLSNAGWEIDPTTSYIGSASFKAVTTPNNQVIGLTAYRYLSDQVEISRTRVSCKPDGSVDKFMQATAYKDRG